MHLARNVLLPVLALVSLSVLLAVTIAPWMGNAKSDTPATGKECRAKLAGIEEQVAAAYKRAAPTIVRITRGKNLEQPAGSGVVVTADGYVVTGRFRAIQKGETLALHFPDGRRLVAAPPEQRRQSAFPV